MKKLFAIVVLGLLTACASDLDWTGQRAMSFAENTCRNLNIAEDNISGSEWHKCRGKYLKVALEIEKNYVYQKSDKHSGDFISMQEYSLQKEASKKDDIKMTFSYENSNGQVVKKDDKDSLWKSFWGTVGYVLYEYGDIILDAAIEAKYGSPQQTNTPKMKCVSQRVGSSKMVHTTCRQIN